MAPKKGRSHQKRAQQEEGNKPDVAEHTYETLEREETKDKKKSCKKPPWWAWILIFSFIGFCILCTMIVLLMIFIPRGSPSDDKPSSFIGEPSTVTPAANKRVVPPLVIRGPNSGETTYHRRVIQQTSRRLPSSVSYIRQPADINTLGKCIQACLGSAGDGLLPSGATCQGAEFEESTRTCILTDSGLSSSLRYGYGWISIRILYHFFPDTAPGCFINYLRWHNRRLVQAFNIRLSNATTSFTDCADRCSFFYCLGFTFDKRSLACTMYFSQAFQEGFHPSLEVAGGIEFFLSVNLIMCNFCNDSYTMSHPDYASIGRIYQTGRFLSARDCKNRCERRHGPPCYGFDYSQNTRTCHINTDTNYSLSQSVGTVNYRRKIICQGCLFKTKYISTVDSIPSHAYGTTYTETLIYFCAIRCQGVNATITSETCYGFTYNPHSNRCVLYHSFGYDLGAIGGSPGDTHYRRLFQCNEKSSCRESYTKTRYASSSGGIKQPKDFNTLARCANRCEGYAVATDQTCYGLDFNRRTKECLVYLQDDYRLVHSDDTDNYRRNMDCPRPSG